MELPLNCEPAVCAIAAEVSTRTSNAIVVINFRIMGLPSWGPLTVIGNGGTRSQDAARLTFCSNAPGTGDPSRPVAHIATTTVSKPQKICG
jgi:hypothetical protein